MTGLKLNKIKPKELRSITSGRVFGYTEALAKRSDMVAVWPNGVDPNFGQEPMTEEQVNDSKTGQIRDELMSKNAIISNMQTQMDEMAAEIERLNDENSKLRQMLEPSVDDPSVKNTPTDKVNPPEINERQAKIIAAAHDIMEKKEKNDFTGQGKIRIGRLEEESGISDITAEERDIAMAQVG